MRRLDHDYLLLPHRLLADLRANPVAIGVYALVARLFLIYQEPIPLSAADLQRYDPALSYGAARGALQRLATLRWLDERSGHKNHYTPTWGVLKGSVRPWDVHAPTLNRPANRTTLRLDRRLLDVGLGKIVPHPTYPAQTNERYVERPILSLRDVGMYAQVLAGQHSVDSPALVRYGLIYQGHAQPLPSTEALIALASQRVLVGDGAPPTEQGRRKLGLALTNPPTNGAASQPLFFVDRDLIPDPITCSIPDVIPPIAADEGALIATECCVVEGACCPSRSTGNSGRTSEISDLPTNHAQPCSCGGRNSHQEKCKRSPRISQPENETIRLLRSINAFPKSVEELATMPPALVEQAIAYARAEPGIESVPGWVVETLRRSRDEGWSLPAPRTLQNDVYRQERRIDVEKYTGGVYGDLFRRGGDISGLGDSAHELAKVEIVQSANVSPAFDEDRVSVALPFQEGVCDEAFTRRVQSELLACCGRRYRQVIAGLAIQVADSTTLLICATPDDMRLVHCDLMGAIHPLLRGLGVPEQVACITRAAWEVRRTRADVMRSRSVTTPQVSPLLL